MVAKYYGIEKDELLKRKKATQRQRSVAVYLSKILSGRENAEVGRKFGITIQAVTNTLSRVRRMRNWAERLPH